MQNNEILLAEYGQISSNINDFGSLLEQDGLLVYKELLDDVVIQMGTLHRQLLNSLNPSGTKGVA